MTPFTTFNFHVALTLPDRDNEVCQAEFSECDGLEMSMEVKTIREGGNNGEQIHLAGGVTYGQITLKRGMTRNFDLWDWFEMVQLRRNVRADGEIRIQSSSPADNEGAENARRNNDVTFSVIGCIPVKMRAPSLNAKDGEIAIEEMQIAYERLMRISQQQQAGVA